MLSELKRIPEYETYEDYVDSRVAMGFGVVPKDVFERIKEKDFKSGFEFKVEEYVR